MRFDFVPYFHPGENISWTRTLDMMRQQTRVAEDVGFTTVWVTEHHFAHNGYLNAPPNPILVNADLALHCPKIRVGQAPVVLPDWHPLRVAEDIAMLDNMTNGRVDFGVARGIPERASIQFDKRADKRDGDTSFRMMRESLEIILNAWTEDPFRNKGEFYEFPVPGWKEKNRFLEPFDGRYYAEDGEYVGMYVHPRPVQEPHPPVWFMSNSPHTFEQAGKEGHNAIAMSAPLQNLKTCWSAFQKTASERQGRELGYGEGLGLCIVIFCAETMEEADALVRPALNHYYEYVGGSQPNPIWLRGQMLGGKDLSQKDKDADWFDFLQAHNLSLVGTPDYVCEKLAMFQEEIGLEQVMLLQQFPHFPFEKILASMDLIAQQVMPRVVPIAREAAE